jgi:two-component system, OmpR family, response regulator
MLFRDVWNYKFLPRSNVLHVHMGRLRRKLDAPGEVPMITNVRGAGYTIDAPS